NQLQGYCTMVGRVPYEDLGHYLALADIALEPKFFDSGEASGKLLNYMEAGLPIVCFNTISNRHILGNLGYFVPEGAGELLDQIEAVIGEPEKADRRATAGRKRVREKFSWDIAGKIIQDVYYSCLIPIP
ncbi:MAG: glycosyltransferase, partial [Methylococcales bacterium]|nr:glycosyltransferase [Methylococcales bacterium]